jgi:uncharacterized protein YcaQ
VGGTRHVPLAQVTGALVSLVGEGQAVPVAIDGVPGQAWLDSALLPRLAELRAGRGRPTLTTLLSPFDNLIWYRPRTEALFGFEYRIECYTPAPKRKYGYYSLPILHRGRLIGRLDPSYDRRQRRLTIKVVHLEPSVRPTAPLATAIAGALHDLNGFLGGTEITIARSDPAPFATLLGERLEAISPAADGMMSVATR